MLISLQEIKKYVNIPAEVTTKDLLELIGARLVEIEEAIDLTPKYQGIYIVKVISAEKIPDTHLTLCQIDAGEHTREFNTVSATPTGSSSEEGQVGSNSVPTVQVVCGAPNVHAGMLAVWIAPGSIVPSTFGNENFRLSVRKLQGYESNGMLAAIDELDLGADHDGIAEIDPKSEAHPGDSFAETFGLCDTIIDVENKSLTHRPDCFGLIGFAREVAGILGVEFHEPEWLTNGLTNSIPLNSAASSLALPKIEISSTELCPRYSCAIFAIPDNTPSKYLTHQAVFLAKAGMRAIDPMVDLTNVIMLETGQPLHAFDYDKFIAAGSQGSHNQADGAPRIVVRSAENGEELQLLDGKTIKCIPEDILITSNGVPVALAGAMGGKNTEIDASTTHVILESATFSLFHLRKTQMAHGIFSEAITRFTKGQPASMTLPVLTEAIAQLGVAADFADSYPNPAIAQPITISVNQVNALLGSAYDEKIIKTTLENVGFKVASAAAKLEVTAPAWRTDIHIPEDVIEEIGRLLGFDNLPLSLPNHPFHGAEISPMWSLKQELRHLLSGKLQMHELLTYSFISRSLLEKSGQNIADSYEIVNSISPELECFRQHIVPSLLDKVRENERAGFKNFTIYEMNQVSQKSAGLTTEGTPALSMHLGIVSLGDFYNLKAKLLALLGLIHLPLEYRAMTPSVAVNYPYLEPRHSAELLLGGEVIGAFGELKQSVLRKFKLDNTISACELALDQLANLPRTISVDLKLSKFPYVERDFTLKVAASAQFGRFHDVIEGVLTGEGLIAEVTPVSIYQGSDTSTKNISFHLKFSNPTKTLAQEEISGIMETITVEAVKLGAEVV